MIVNWEAVISYIFAVEIVVLLGFLLLIPFHRVYLHYGNKKEGAAKDQIKKAIIHSVLNHTNINAAVELKKYSGSYPLLSTVEAFDRKLKGEEWNQVKGHISEAHLLSKARRWEKSWSWKKRNFAARCFALAPLERNEKVILKLVNDSTFLVNSAAAKAAIQLQNKEAVLKVIEHMGREKGYARLYYRDLFSKMSFQVFSWIKEFAKRDKDSKVHLACLEILGDKALGEVPIYIKSDQKSKDSKIRLHASKIIAANPHKDTPQLLEHSINDPDDAVRAEAVSGYFYFPGEQTFNTLENLLKDTSLPVRNEAAQTLWKMGEKGMQILKKQQANLDLNAFEAAQIALQYHGR